MRPQWLCAEVNDREPVDLMSATRLDKYIAPVTFDDLYLRPFSCVVGNGRQNITSLSTCPYTNMHTLCRSRGCQFVSYSSKCLEFSVAWTAPSSVSFWPLSSPTNWVGTYSKDSQVRQTLRWSVCATSGGGGGTIIFWEETGVCIELVGVPRLVRGDFGWDGGRCSSPFLPPPLPPLQVKSDLMRAVTRVALNVKVYLPQPSENLGESQLCIYI